MSLITYSTYEEAKVIFLTHLQQRKALLNLQETLQTPHERRVLLYLRNRHHPASLHQICQHCHLQKDDATTLLKTFIDKNLARQVGEGFFTSP